MPKPFYVTLECCPEVRQHKTVFLSYYLRHGNEVGEDMYGGAPEWVVRSWKNHRDDQAAVDMIGDDGYVSLARARSCPHCSTPVPEIERRQTSREVCAVDGVHDGHCTTCTLRLNICRCMPPEYKYQPKGAAGGDPGNLIELPVGGDN